MMWKAVMSSRWANWVVGKVSLPKERQLQQELDLQRLYILTQLHKAAEQGKAMNMPQLMLKSKSLELSALREEVEEHLTRQVLGTAEALHGALLQAGDPALPARRLASAHARLQAHLQEEKASGFSKLLRSVGLGGGGSSSSSTGGSSNSSSGSGSAGVGGLDRGMAAAGTRAGAEAEVGAGAAAGGSSGRWLSQVELGEALARRCGFRLELGPSSVPHPEAGTGLFLRGEAKPGAVVAIFPGVVYGRTQLTHMPNYPKVDTDNPYLSCRYDQSIVDSKPWGTGDPGGPATSHDDPKSAANSSGSSSSSSSSTSIGRDAPRWWRWCGPLSAALGRLEGRHPLALGHYVNHPGQGQSPNVLETSLDVPVDHPALDLPNRPWLRAYLPAVQPPLSYEPYDKEDAEDDDGDGWSSDSDEEEDDALPGKEAGGESRRVSSSGSSRASRRPGPGELRARDVLSPPGGVVRLLVLVSTRAIKDGEELLQNYRMNPHVLRPEWYVVHDAEAEQRRWAKIRALDLGFKKSPAGDQQQQQQQPPP